MNNDYCGDKPYSSPSFHQITFRDDTRPLHRYHRESRGINRHALIGKINTILGKTSKMVGAWTGDQYSAVSIRGLMAECRVLTADANIQLRIPQLFGSGSAGLASDQK